MNAEKNFYELHRKWLNRFLDQNPETGKFDLVFEIAGTKLYAHKSKLCDVSKTFSGMLSDLWTSPNQPVKLESFSFNDFREFITFIYSGECTLDHDNISAMVDIAEFYGVKKLKEECENFLLKVVLDQDNVYSMFELAYKYSMENLTESLLKYVSMNLLVFIESEQFLSLPRTMVYDVVKSNQDTLRQEKLFEMVYKWAENQDSDLESIKNELSSLLTFFKFHLMHNDFLIDFVVKKSFLFSGDELSQHLSSARYLITVQHKNGKMMKGVLNCPDVEEVFHIVQSKKKKILVDFFFSYGFQLLDSMKPSEPSKLIKNPGIEWYLVCPNKASFTIKHHSWLTPDDYLLAELTAENGFDFLCSRIV